MTAIVGGPIIEGAVGFSRIRERITKAMFTDGGGASGTYQLAGKIPKGALTYRAFVVESTAFSGDTSAVVVIGDGSDVDRYNTGTPSILAAQANGLDLGAPSGALFHTAEVRPTVTVTSAADFTALSALAVITVEIWFLRTR